MSIKNRIRKLFTMNIVDVAQGLQSLHVQGDVITANLSTGWVEVGEGNIIRVEVGADTYFSFSDQDTGAAVTSATSPAVKIKSGEPHYIVCSNKYVRASANPTRAELLVL